ncbi:MAG: AAA family ATPase [Candidatus Yanofskybacteria bacterium]|nr:AAA family ATPase [Candidatus Yanofskybacteria bacterium]
MKLVFLYGPPAVGKLTVAKALSEKTGFKLLHNHLFADLVRSVFDYNNVVGRNVHKSIRIIMYEAATRNGIDGLIFTFSYYGGIEDDVAVKEWVDITKKHGDKIYFVRLSCIKEELEKRVLNPSRIGTKKVTEVDKLRKIMREENPCMEIPRDIIESLHIDNTSLEPENTALAIKSHYNL